METIIEATSQTKLGRPRRTGPPPMTIHMRMPRRLWQATKTAAATECLPLTCWIRRTLVEALASRARKKKKAA